MNFLEQLIAISEGENIVIDYSLVPEGEYAAIPIEVKHEPDGTNSSGAVSAKITVTYQLSQEGIQKDKFTKAEYYSWLMDESRDTRIRTRMLGMLVAKLVGFGILNVEILNEEIQPYIDDTGFVEVPSNLSEILEKAISTDYREKNIKMVIKDDVKSGRKNNEFKIIG